MHLPYFDSKRYWILGFTFLFFLSEKGLAYTADSVYLFSYTTQEGTSRNGLQFAWSNDKTTWFTIGNGYGYLKSDYGRWGSEKKIFAPFLFPGPDQQWHCVWSVNDHDPYFAQVASADLLYWGRQIYPKINEGLIFLQPVVSYDAAQQYYMIRFKTGNNKYGRISTKDFKTYSAVTEIPADQYSDPRVSIDLSGNKITGVIYKVPWTMVQKLIDAYQQEQYQGALYAESTREDSERFAGLRPVEASIKIEPSRKKPISDMLVGVFFEDINYAADGGLYAELIQNRDFEYALSDKEGRDSSWNSRYAWELKGSNTGFSIDSIQPLHPNNMHYAVLDTKIPGAALVNAGFDGIVLKKGDQYNLSFFAKQANGKNVKVEVRLVNKQGAELAKTVLSVSSAGWKKITTTLTASSDATDAQLELKPLQPGKLLLDMISLFPQRTFKGRKNGLRSDLAQVIANIHPKFIRFPGGCVAHGDGLGNIYRWKNSIGPLEARKPQRNLWGYHQTTGLGYFEYFQFCEDIGAEPLPVIAAGVPCQNSATGGPGQQGGVSLDQMDDYIQDILDLIEWANGDINTKWGKTRAEEGHPKPFNLKYIGIGNEDLISDVFEERYAMICTVMKEKHPEITIIGTVGPAAAGTDYTEGWKLADELKLPMVDEHYYQSPGWFINNQDFYDKYDRSKSKVYLGEYAAHLPGRPNNLETALAEALYLTALERNADVVSMASYAPLLAKDKHTQWNPDLIYFNNAAVKPTVGYYVQEIYGMNAGDEYIPGSIVLSNKQQDVRNRIAFSVVRDSKSNDLIIKLVNLLPVPVNAGLDLSGIDIASPEAVKTILTGTPGDKAARPVTSSCTISQNQKEELPAYSFTVLRLKIK